MILILGVTGSGKGRLAFELARGLDGEIVSVDSMKVYRGMDIGTAKPSLRARGEVCYHLIDVVEPYESFSVGRFVELAEEAIGQIKRRGKAVIGVGGTALYLKALLYGLFEGPGSDESVREKLRRQISREGLGRLYEKLSLIDAASAERIHANDAKRIIRALEVYELSGKPISSFQHQFDVERVGDEWTIIGVRRDKEVENSRINMRVKKMVEDGLVDEVKGLVGGGKTLSKQASCAIGYGEIIEHLSGKVSLDEAVEQIKKNSRHFAKGQRTWFKRFKEVNWLDIAIDECPDEILCRAQSLLGEQE